MDTTRSRVRTSVDSVDVLYYRAGAYCIVNKPYDIRTDTASATSPDEITLEKLTLAAIAKYEATAPVGTPVFVPPLRPCHQLDLATSGVMCYALSTESAADASYAFASRRTTKTYLALVYGHMISSSGILDWPLASDANDARRFTQILGTVHAPGRSAFTRFVVLQRGMINDRPATKVALLPQTGRRHQLRVHLASLGHPIVGDYGYCGDTISSRMMLHAWRLSLPLSSSTIDVEAPSPFPPLVDAMDDPLSYDINYAMTVAPSMVGQYQSAGVLPYTYINGRLHLLLARQPKRPPTVKQLHNRDDGTNPQLSSTTANGGRETDEEELTYCWGVISERRRATHNDACDTAARALGRELLYLWQPPVIPDIPCTRPAAIHSDFPPLTTTTPSEASSSPSPAAVVVDAATVARRLHAPTHEGRPNLYGVYQYARMLRRQGRTITIPSYLHSPSPSPPPPPASSLIHSNVTVTWMDLRTNDEQKSLTAAAITHKGDINNDDDDEDDDPEIRAARALLRSITASPPTPTPTPTTTSDSKEDDATATLDNDNDDTTATAPSSNTAARAVKPRGRMSRTARRRMDRAAAAAATSATTAVTQDNGDEETQQICDVITKVNRVWPHVVFMAPLPPLSTDILNYARWKHVNTSLLLSPPVPAAAPATSTPSKRQPDAKKDKKKSAPTSSPSPSNSKGDVTTVDTSVAVADAQKKSKKQEKKEKYMAKKALYESGAAPSALSSSDATMSPVPSAAVTTPLPMENNPSPSVTPPSAIEVVAIAVVEQKVPATIVPTIEPTPATPLIPSTPASSSSPAPLHPLLDAKCESLLHDMMDGRIGCGSGIGGFGHRRTPLLTGELRWLCIDDLLTHHDAPAFWDALHHHTDTHSSDSKTNDTIPSVAVVTARRAPAAGAGPQTCRCAICQLHLPLGVQLLENRIVIVRRDELWQPGMMKGNKARQQNNNKTKAKKGSDDSSSSSSGVPPPVSEPVWRSHRAKRKKFELIELDDALSNALRVPSTIATLRALASQSSSSSSSLPSSASSSSFYGDTSSSIINVPIVMASR